MKLILDSGGFDRLCDRLLASRLDGEELLIDLMAEDSRFVRFNRGRVRQAGTVADATLQVTLVQRAEAGLKTAKAALTLSGDTELDFDRATTALGQLRLELPGLPVDPYIRIPARGAKSQVRPPALDHRGKALDDEALEDLLALVSGLDFNGLLTSGEVARAAATSTGIRHWFETRSMQVDYSIFQAERSLKGLWSAPRWDRAAFAREIDRARPLLPFLERPARRLERGSYRAFLAPAAVADLIAMLSWGAIGESSIRQGTSPLRLLRSGERTLSPLFNLSEDFTPGDVPKFNEDGELAPEKLPLISAGRLESALVSSRSAREYGLEPNGADAGEYLRSPVMAAAPAGTPGSFREDGALGALGTGLYLSNLHYLNWSDQPQGRITGMTRYACFWVENGQVQAPIENMRFDDTLFHLLGAELEALTDRQVAVPERKSYGHREIGATRVPGILVKGMQFTL